MAIETEGEAALHVGQGPGRKGLSGTEDACEFLPPRLDVHHVAETEAVGLRKDGVPQ